MESRGRVSDLCWVYLIFSSLFLTVLNDSSIDQTSRIHAPILDPNRNNTFWHEVARPQVHGYDILDAVFINSLKFVSISDEKVARVFEAPQSFVDSAENLRVATFSDEEVRGAYLDVQELICAF